MTKKKVYVHDPLHASIPQEDCKFKFTLYIVQQYVQPYAHLVSNVLFPLWNDHAFTIRPTGAVQNNQNRMKFSNITKLHLCINVGEFDQNVIGKLEFYVRFPLLKLKNHVKYLDRLCELSRCKYHKKGHPHFKQP